MRRHTHNTLRQWLSAEASADHGGAETSLFELFSTLPAVQPSAGFAGRVLAASGIEAPRPAWGWASRLALAASLVLVAASSSVLLPVALELLGLLTPAEVVTSLVDGMLAIGHRLEDILPLWQLATTLYRTLVQVVGSPPVLITLLAMTLLSATALRGLMSLVPARRSLTYV